MTPDPILPPGRDDLRVQLAPASMVPGPFEGSEEEGVNSGSTGDLRRLLALTVRNIWIIAIFGFIGLAAGWYITWRATPTYEATASVRITEGGNTVPGLDVLNMLGGNQSEVNTELEVLRSRTLVGRVVDELALQVAVLVPRKYPRSLIVQDVAVGPNATQGIYHAARSGGVWTITSPSGRTARSMIAGSAFELDGLWIKLGPATDTLSEFSLRVVSRENALRAATRALRVARPARDANILTVTWRGSDPAIVAAVPNSLVSAFITRRINTRKAGARSTVAFLNDQIDTLANELKTAEANLRSYRESTGVVSFDEQARLTVGKLADLQAERSTVAAELRALEGTLRQIETHPSDSSGTSWRALLAFPTLVKIPALSSLLTNLNALEQTRSDLLVRRTTKDPDVIALTTQIASLERQVRALVMTYMEGLRQQVTSADRTLQVHTEQVRRIPAEEVRLAELQRRTQIFGDLFTLLQTKRKEAEIAQAVEDPSAQIVDFAQKPERPVSPILSRNVTICGILAVMMAFFVGFTRESLDTKLRTSDQLKEVTGLPVLGIVPHLTSFSLPSSRRALLAKFGSRNGQALVSAKADDNALHEAFRALRVNISFSTAIRPPKLVLVTSAFPGDGKSTAVINLAKAMGEQRLRVLVIDADMRRGALHKSLNSLREPGLSEILVGRAEPEAVIQTVKFDRLGPIDFISTGTIPPNPTELLGGPGFAALVKAVEPLYEMIIFDSPPVNSVSDPLLMANSMDGVILVARGGKTERNGLRFAQQQLAHVRARILGAILNDYDTSLAAYYGGYYNRAYGDKYATTTD